MQCDFTKAELIRLYLSVLARIELQQEALDRQSVTDLRERVVINVSVDSLRELSEKLDGLIEKAT